MLEHGAGGPADITVGAVQVRPSEGDGLGVLDAVEGFELLAECLSEYLLECLLLC